MSKYAGHYTVKNHSSYVNTDDTAHGVTVECTGIEFFAITPDNGTQGWSITLSELKGLIRDGRYVKDEPATPAPATPHESRCVFNGNGYWFAGRRRITCGYRRCSVCMNSTYDPDNAGIPYVCEYHDTPEPTAMFSESRGAAAESAALRQEAKDDATMNSHYHVVEFINGCLNDYDSGPIASIADARNELQFFLGTDDFDDDSAYVPAGKDRYERGLHILKIETCNEDCDPNADY
jgi:hypothetical protein